MLGMIIILLLSRRQNYDSYKLANMIILMVLNAKEKKKCLRLPSSMTPFVLGEKVETFDLYYCQKSDMNFSPIVVVKA